MQKITEEIFIGGRGDIFLSADIVDNKTSVQITPKNSSFKFPRVLSYLNVAADLNINGAKLPKVGLIDGKGNSKESLKKAVNTLEALIKEHGNVMVFCHKGESRSPLVVLAYLHSKKSMGIDEAYDLIRFAKPDINISPFLSLMLCELSGEKYFECSDSPETETSKAEPSPNATSTKKRKRAAQKK